ncbi:cofilin-2 isoform X1 [Physeter macrocephalus]|uniref:Cofilin-2 isoform X1 n=1 Tax=Physeter macrocephalus TaxID=9755 RepID=A0A9W2WYZ1_PHYMC|nr:cofilin-2 isoform X1 [Physeter catodon]
MGVFQKDPQRRNPAPFSGNHKRIKETPWSAIRLTRTQTLELRPGPREAVWKRPPWEPEDGTGGARALKAFALGPGFGPRPHNPRGLLRALARAGSGRERGGAGGLERLPGACPRDRPALAAAPRAVAAFWAALPACLALAASRPPLLPFAAPRSRSPSRRRSLSRGRYGFWSYSE